MADLTKNPDLRSREKVDDYFGDWKWREGLAELMVPIIGRLYRNGINIMIYGKSLVNESPVDIMSAHRFVRQIEGNELSELETFPLLEHITTMDLPDCEIDLGELTMRCPFFKDAEVNFDTDNFGGQLTIKSPNSRLPNISSDSPLEDRVNYVIYNEINPMLETHGGVVSLMEITDDKYAVLQFGGGCQGCGMVDVTLKDGIEKTLLDTLPELSGIKDMTDHSIDDHAYYKGES